LTLHRASRTPAGILRGEWTSAWSVVGLLLVAAACEGGTRTPSDQALVDMRPDAAETGEPVPPSAVLTSIQVYSGVGEEVAGSRAVLSFEGAPLFEQEHLPAQGILPPRLAIHLKNTAWHDEVPVSTAVGRGGLRRVRLATPDPRVVLDLEAGASGRVFYLTDPYRIVVDVNRGAPSSHARPLVVLDPGHGGSEPGAANDELELVESELALVLAKLTAERLVEIMPRARVMLTRTTDVDLTLEERSALANSMEADLFVSIHLNASSEQVSRGGVTTFVLDTTNDRQALRLAARENGTRVAEVTGIQSILAKHHRKTQVAGSLELANRIQRGTLEGGRAAYPSLADRGVRRAMFYVLVGARMPAVLLEASFLTHPPEARALSTARYRNALAYGIASGIASYLRRR
jgi:N-acetylmuramoyl-L-alanine amidase